MYKMFNMGHRKINRLSLLKIEVLTVIGDTTKRNECGLPEHQAWSPQ